MLIQIIYIPIVCEYEIANVGEDTTDAEENMKVEESEPIYL